MKGLPDVNISFEPLTRMLYGAIPTKLLLTGIQFKVFSHLTEPRSGESLADKLGTHPPSTRSLLDGLTANGLLCKRDERYRNTPLSDTFLVDDRPTYLGDVLRNLYEYSRPALEAMTTIVRTGQSPPVTFADTSLQERETEIYANDQRAGRAQQAAAAVSTLPEFPRMRRMLDLGGGAGLIGSSIVAAHPSMTGVLFDRPGVVKVARGFIREYGLEDRVTVMAGDFATDSIGDGYDLVWTSFVLNFFRGKLDPILRKIHAALAPGGVFVNLAEGLTEERTKPTMMVNSMLFGRSDLMFDEGEIAQAMLRVGFRSVHSRVAEGPQPHGPVMIDVARK